MVGRAEIAARIRALSLGRVGAEYMAQVTAIGPLGLEYLDCVDDPLERNRQ